MIRLAAIQDTYFEATRSLCVNESLFIQELILRGLSFQYDDEMAETLTHKAIRHMKTSPGVKWIYNRCHVLVCDDVATRQLLLGDITVIRQVFELFASDSPFVDARKPAFVRLVASASI